MRPSPSSTNILPAVALGQRRTRWSVLFELLLVFVVLLVPRVASAAPPAQGQPVITPGREDEILALFAPHALGDEVVPGWTLYSFSIDTSTISVWLAGPEDTYANFALDHPDHHPEGARQLEGFALTILEQPPGSEAALDELVAIVEQNDGGRFWRERVAYAGDNETQAKWYLDGLLLTGAFTLFVLIVVVDRLRGAEPWVKWSLLGVALVGAISRVGLSPTAPLGVWPYTRFLAPAQLIYEGRTLGLVHPDPVWASELIFDCGLYFALLAPLVLYAHARCLLEDQRAALVVAAMVALLPIHLRFSHSDAAFIPSITISSFVFTLVHLATRDPKRWLGWLAALLVALPLALTYQVRPLNIMYYPLLLATVFVNRGLWEDKPAVNVPRAVVAYALITVATGFGIYWLVWGLASKIDEGLRILTLMRAAWVIFHPKWNILLNPVFTPPLLTVLAVLGGVDLWRRGRRRLLGFLLVWLLLFLVGHSYFLPRSVYMQARYHLHLVVPYLLLAACGVDRVLRWLAAEREQRAWLAGRRYHAVIGAMVAYLLASPLIHLHAIRYINFNEVHEWEFVHTLREEIPQQCTIVEFVGVGADSRFERVGSYVEAGRQHTSWTVLEIPLEVSEPDAEVPEVVLPPEVLEVLHQPPECLYWYEGLPCFAFKPQHAPKASTCEAIEGFVELEEVAATSFEAEVYDGMLGVGIGERRGLELRLFRARAK